MAESERCDEGITPERILADGRLLPADFTAEEATTAQWLNDHFSVSGENLPPRYVQTLLGDPRLAPATDDFEDQMVARVFAQLDLARSVPSATATPHSLRTRLRASAERLTQRMSRQGAVVIMALVMLFSYNALGTGVALASVLQLFAGRGGTQAVVKYPKVIATNLNGTAAVSDHTLKFMPNWPGASTNGYTYTGMDLLNSQWWTRGALVALHYERDDQAGAHHLTVLEFQPQVQMALQVVQDGSSAPVRIGTTNGIFVWGHWVRQSHDQMVWAPSQRAELVYGGTDANNPVTWIAADDLSNQSADEMKATLTDVATTLHPMFLPSIMATENLGDIGARLSSDLNQPFSNDIIALIPDHSDPSQPVVYVRVGPYLAGDE